jgi:outer membrane biogenesis lipoprotein LolB
MKSETIIDIIYATIVGLVALLLLTACIVTPPMITDVYRDGDDLVFHKATIQVNTVTYQVNERDGRDIRVNIK